MLGVEGLVVVLGWVLPVSTCGCCGLVEVLGWVLPVSTCGCCGLVEVLGWLLPVSTCGLVVVLGWVLPVSTCGLVVAVVVVDSLFPVVAVVPVPLSFVVAVLREPVLLLAKLSYRWLKLSGVVVLATRRGVSSSLFPKMFRVLVLPLEGPIVFRCP